MIKGVTYLPLRLSSFVEQASLRQMRNHNQSLTPPYSSSTAYNPCIRPNTSRAPPTPKSPSIAATTTIAVEADRPSRPSFLTKVDETTNVFLPSSHGCTSKKKKKKKKNDMINNPSVQVVQSRQVILWSKNLPRINPHRQPKPKARPARAQSNGVSFDSGSSFLRQERI